MKLDIDNSPIGGNVQSTSSFGFKIGAKMFEAFSSTIYSDKIKAVLRELSTNAYDSHVQNGNPKVPFDVKLPSKYEHQLDIRDYGIGMSNEKIAILYSNYFDSDKTDSNDLNGCFGIGSKAPFCYSDTYTISSYFNGVLTIFMAFKGNDGVPQLSKLEEIATTEPNGIKISVPCQPHDAVNFANKAWEVYRYFKTKPNFVNGETFDWAKEKFLIEEADYAVIDDEYTVAQSVVVMGNIGYPINERIYGRPFVLHCNIGDVSITLSRESLKMDKKTIDYLAAKKAEINDRIVKYVEDIVDKAPNYWEACRAFGDVKISPTGKTPKYKGKDLKKEFHLTSDEISFNGVWKSSRGGIKEDVKRYIRPSQIDLAHVYEKDVPVPGRMKFWIENNKGKELYTVSFKDAAAKKLWEDITGIPAVFPPTSSLPKPPKGTYTQYKGKIYKYNGSQYYRSRNWAGFSYNGEVGYYVLTDGTTLDGISLEQFRQVLHMMGKKGDKNPIFRIPKSNRKKLLASLDPLKVKPLYDIYLKYKSEYATNAALIEDLSGKQWLNANKVDFVEKLNVSDPDLDDLKSKIKKWRKVDLNGYSELISWGILKPSPVKIPNLENFYSKFPIAKWMGQAYNLLYDKEIINFTEQEIKDKQATQTTGV